MAGEWKKMLNIQDIKTRTTVFQKEFLVNHILLFDYTGECSTSSNDANSISRMRTSCVSYFYMSEVLHDIKPNFLEEFKPTKLMGFKDVLEGMAGFDVHMNTLRKDGDIIKHRCYENQVLNAIFWADEIDKAYYNEFGDVMLFGATFHTNNIDCVCDISRKKLPKKRNWEILMKEFNLEDERWFKDIFENKEAWVPTYFNDFPRRGLMKTKSRFESINSFFNVYS
uniref:Protein FAR1-RELATED SEQUENCE n=1 Tax=Lactuca sativa TaxID=4236 RepID=A0A9R1UR00_LACSA|nr:hypothetical protein LSAT_V11C800423000 [Lactuca sativa]